MRFDEIELEAVPLGTDDETPTPQAFPDDAPRLRRLAALLTDVSLFAAVVLALSPLLPTTPQAWRPIAALAGFMVVLSYYYFVGTWMLWGKTIGGAIFDVRVVPGRTWSGEPAEAMSLRNATLRWTGVYLSLLTAGLGFAIAALPARRSLPDRMSGTRCVRG